MARRLAAIVFTDIVDFTRSTRVNEAGSLALLRTTEGLVRPLVSGFDGREIKSTGDGLLLEFESALKAVEFAIEVQQQMRTRNVQEPSGRVELRIGIHVGDVEETGTDILGDAVNVAARIVRLAEPGGIVLSEGAAGHVRHRMPCPMARAEEGPAKGLDEPLVVYHVVLPWSTRPVTTAAGSSHRLAVLPFLNISPNAGDEYFADGLTEELITAISQVPGLEVISRTSVMQYKHKPKPIREIGKELDVRTVLEGSVRKDEGRVRITVQLIDTGTDSHRWAGSFDRDIVDIFSLQSEVARQVAGSMSLTLLDEAARAIGRPSTKDPEAYTLYLRSLAAYRGGDERGRDQAIELAEAALKRDPSFAKAYVLLARAYALWGFSESAESPQHLEKARRYAKSALACDDLLAEAHVQLSLILANDLDWAAAERELDRAGQLDPNLPVVHADRAFLLMNSLKFEEAMFESRKALELDPLSKSMQAHLATRLLGCRRAAEAAVIYEQLIAEGESSRFIRGNLGICQVLLGNPARGAETLRQAQEMPGEYQPVSRADYVFGLARAGRKEEAKQIAQELIDYRREKGVGSMSVALAFGALGEYDRAFEWLESAYTERTPYLAGVAMEFALEDVRHDPRMRAFLAKMHHPALDNLGAE